MVSNYLRQRVRRSAEQKKQPLKFVQLASNQIQVIAGKSQYMGVINQNDDGLFQSDVTNVTPEQRKQLDNHLMELNQ